MSSKARRERGDGSVYRRSDGRWAGALSVQLDGRRVRRTVYGKTKAEVLTKLRQTPTEPEQRTLNPQARCTTPSVAEFVGEWLAVTLPLQVRPSTVSNYSTVLRLHLLPQEGHRKLSELSTRHLQALYAERMSSGLSARSVALLHAVIRRMLGDAEQHGLVQGNVARKMRAPRVPRRNGRTMTPEQARELLRSAQGHPLEAMVLLGLAGGLRPGESLALRWTDIDFNTSTVHVRHSLTSLGNGRFVVGETKTSSSVRAVALPAFAMERLRCLPREGAFVLSAPDGRQRDPNNVRRHFKALCRSAGVGEWTPHEMRHSVASFLLSEGASLRLVADVLGHSSVTVTGDVYAHLLPNALSGAAGRLDALLGQ